MKKRTISERLDYSNPYMEIRHARVEFGDFRKEFFIVELGPRAGIVALQRGRVLLTRQYRYLIDGYSWEIPGGKVDKGETPETAAVRECIEETGVRCSDLKPLVAYYPGLDNFNNRTTLFYSETAWIELRECIERVYQGEFLDALTVTGLLAYAARLPQHNARR
jgi:ADP-ribose pyrophosphatase